MGAVRGDGMTFHVSEKQHRRALIWSRVHARHCAVLVKRTAGEAEYTPLNWTFSPIGIGCGLKIACAICGVEKDLTDHSTW